MKRSESSIARPRGTGQLLPALLAAGVLVLTVLVTVGPARGDVPAVDPMQPGLDEFPSQGQVNVTLDNVPGRGQVTEDIEVSSEGLPDAQVQRGALQDSTIPTEITAMQLQGQSPTLGPVHVTVGRDYGLQPSQGQVQNVELDKDGHLFSGDSFFDVFFEIFAPQSPFGPLSAQNDEALNMKSEIFDLPPNRPKATPAQAAAIDHFKCYRVRQTRIRGNVSGPEGELLEQGRKPSRQVRLTDQLESRSEKVLKPVRLCNPVEKDYQGSTTPIQDSESHLVCYRIDERTKGFKREAVGVKSQFGAVTVDLRRRDSLCLPSSKEVLRGKHRKVPKPQPQKPLSHFKCYTAAHRGPAASFAVLLGDQFERRRDKVLGPTRVCNPVKKDGSKVSNEFAHLSCHPFEKRKLPARIVEVSNQFGLDFLTVRRRDSLCLPTYKTRCSEYAEKAKVPILGPGGVPVGTVNSAIHVPYEGNPEGDCP